jgi:hypothetical protein
VCISTVTPLFDFVSLLGQAIVRNHFPDWEYTPEVFHVPFGR